ncbi:MAG: hypothetical protein ACRDT6_00325 [Micromonosporaceae bacterium]
MTALSAPQLARYLRAQLRAAAVLLADHRTRREMCSCGRPQPCPVAQAVTARRDHFAAVLVRVAQGRAVGRATVRRQRPERPGGSAPGEPG